MMNSIRPIYIALSLVVFITACSNNLYTRLDKQQEQVSRLIAADFTHRIWHQTGRQTVLHVYIEGDGRPWKTRTVIALDPSPREPLMLRLMQMDSAESLYLGRPCYFQTNDPQCAPLWWTHARYSERVVNSMNAALDQAKGAASQIVLLGHSGGGTLAMLMAAKRTDVSAVITLAGNLNVAAWTQHHDYSPLSQSLDPAEAPPLPAKIQQWHYLGDKDHVVQPLMIAPVIKRQHNATLKLLKDVNHNCCWQEQWQHILNSLESL